MNTLAHFLAVDKLPAPDAYEQMSLEDLRWARRQIPPADLTDCPGDDQIYRLHIGIICDVIDIKLSERSIAERQQRIDVAIAALSVIAGTSI